MQTVVVTGGNLFSLAATYLNDATQWIRIAQLNNLVDPMLPNTQLTLLIPNVDLTQTGGVPPQ